LSIDSGLKNKDECSSISVSDFSDLPENISIELNINNKDKPKNCDYYDFERLTKIFAPEYDLDYNYQLYQLKTDKQTIMYNILASDSF